MFKILIVDDERVEREGIKFLIETNHLCLETVEAENGRKALEYIQSNEVDILFTDIKMPFMDGLELAEKAKSIKPGIKIVIFSAFGEFDYARKAIKSNVFYYILKPIDISEFLELMNKLILTCTEEAEQKKKADIIYRGYQSNCEHQRSKILYDLISDERPDDEQSSQRFESIGISFTGYIDLMLVNVKEKIFDTYSDEFEKLLKDSIQCKYEYLNINDRQSLFFLYGFESVPDWGFLECIGQKTRECIFNHCGQISHIMFANPVDDIKELPREYSRIEQALEYRFYYEDGAIMFADNTMQSTSQDKINDNLISEIFSSIESKDFNFTIELVDKLFSSFKLNANVSPVYVKYQSSNILKKIYEHSKSDDTMDFTQQIERIFDNNDIADLKKFILEKLTSKAYLYSDTRHESVKRVVRDVIDIISSEYMKDLSLEYISQKVYLTPSYVSYLFKNEMGMTPIKYITQFRMEKARSLLLNTNMKIVDIAESLGFSNMSYFGMLFRNKYGVSPARLREERDSK